MAATPWLVLNKVSAGPVEYRKGAVVYLTAAQVTSLGASNFRSVNNPLNVNGTAPSSPTHDTLGEASTVSNSS